jgi:hypothetical protein
MGVERDVKSLRLDNGLVYAVPRRSEVLFHSLLCRAYPCIVGGSLERRVMLNYDEAGLGSDCSARNLNDPFLFL